MKIFFSLMALIIFSCVGAPEADHGLVKNLPAIINSPSAFSYILRAENYSDEKNIELLLTLQANQFVASSIIVTESKINDTTMIKIEDDNGEEIYKYEITRDFTELNTTSSKKPKKAIVIVKNFSGIIDLSITAK